MEFFSTEELQPLYSAGYKDESLEKSEMGGQNNAKSSLFQRLSRVINRLCDSKRIFLGGAFAISACVVRFLKMPKPWRRALLVANELAAHFIVAIIVLTSIKLAQTWIGKSWSPPSGNPHAHPKILEGRDLFKINLEWFLAGMTAYRNSVISYLILVVTVETIRCLIYMSYASGHKAGAFIIGGFLMPYISTRVKLYAGYGAAVKSVAEEPKAEKNRD